MPSLVQKTTSNSKQLFLVDGFGALVSAFFLGVVLVYFQEAIGMRLNILYFLAILPVFFAMYSFSCYFLLKKNHRTFIRVIAYANLLYCCLTLSLVVFYYESLTSLGLTYFFVEIIIVGIIIGIQFKASSKNISG